MDKQKIEEQRSRILSNLSDITDITKKIEEEMENVPNPRGVAYRSLKP